ncbi:MAG: MFS transporter [Dehalococcoidia bacterium]|jgi:nitrate/nitrite transporter NarK|nr:MAG: Nitrate/nitrite transporter NarK [Chloroflexota bacterium]|tara:strand:+ start:20849 stop:22138 length:1290 start_codon:yes stop_codon:yes gene_type:complete
MKKINIFFGWYIVLAAMATMFIGGSVQGYATGVFFIPMSEEFNWTRTEFIGSITVSYIVTAIIAVFIGGYLDRHGGRKLMFIGTTIMIICLLLLAEIENLWQWYLIRGVFLSIGVALATFLVVQAAIAKWFVRYRGRAIGISLVGLSITGIMTPSLLTPFVDEFGWRAGWQIMALLTACLLYPAALTMRREPEDYGMLPDGIQKNTTDDKNNVQNIEEKSITRKQAMRTSNFWIVLVAYSLASLTFPAVGAHTIPFLTDAGFERTRAAAMLSLFAFPGLLTRPIWGIIAEKIDIRYLSCFAFIACPIGIGIVLIGTQSLNYNLVIIGYLTLGISISGVVPLQEIVWPLLFGRKHIGSIRGAVMPFMIILSSTSPLLVSAYYDSVGNYTGIWIVFSMLSFFASIMIVFMKKVSSNSTKITPGNHVANRPD